MRLDTGPSTSAMGKQPSKKRASRAGTYDLSKDEWPRMIVEYYIRLEYSNIPLEYSNIPLEYSMESHIPLEYLVEFRWVGSGILF